MNSTKPIFKESFFEPKPKKFSLIEKEFITLDQSIIWSMFNLFWKYYDVWENTFGQHYESSLPSGISESHKTSFIERSAKKFFDHLISLHANNTLPKEIFVLEQGPGTGLYAKQFLSFIRQWSNPTYPFYECLTYVISDMSEKMLVSAQNVLQKHKKHIAIYQQHSLHDVPQEYRGKILFARHSNVLGVFPCRILQIIDGRLYEVLVRAVIDEEALKKESRIMNQELRKISQKIEQGKFEEIITKNQMLWKPIMRAIKLQEKRVSLSEKEKRRLTYIESLEQWFERMRHSGEQSESRIDSGQARMTEKSMEEIIYSTGAVDNLSALSGLIDWQRGGYMEIVDLFSQKFASDRDYRPKKFDGALGVVINGALVQSFFGAQNKEVTFEKVRAMNTMITITDKAVEEQKSLSSLLSNRNFLTLAEIAAPATEPVEHVIAKAQLLFALGLDVIVFSDQAGGSQKFWSVADLAKENMFTRLPGGLIVPVFVTRRKTLAEIKKICAELIAQGVQNLFLVGGDPNKNIDKKESGIRPIDVLPSVSKEFLTGVVAHIDAKDISFLKEKIAAGAGYAITQVCFDEKIWQKWIRMIKKENIHKKSALIAAIIPITSLRVLEMMERINDVAVAKEVSQRFRSLQNDEEIQKEGIRLAKEMIQEIKESSLFSGVYIYTKSEEVVRELITTG